MNRERVTYECAAEVCGRCVSGETARGHGFRNAGQERGGPGVESIVRLFVAFIDVDQLSLPDIQMCVLPMASFTHARPYTELFILYTEQESRPKTNARNAPIIHNGHEKGRHPSIKQ